MQSDTNKQSSFDEMGNRYIHGQLSPQERQEYEVFLLDNPEQVDDVLASAMLKNNLQYASIKSPFKWFSASNWVFSGATAIACCAVFAIMMLTGLVPQQNTPASLQSPDITYVESFRGTSSPTTIYFGKQDERHLLVSPLDTMATSMVKITIASHTNKNMLSYEQKPNGNNEVVIELRKNALSKGIYQLKIQDSQSQEILVEQPLLVSIE